MELIFHSLLMILILHLGDVEFCRGEAIRTGNRENSQYPNFYYRNDWTSSGAPRD